MGEIFQQLATPDADLWFSIAVTLGYACLAVALATIPALWLAFQVTKGVRWPRLRRVVLALAKGAVAVPGLTIGLLVVMVLSHSGPLGFLGLLYHPMAIVAVQVLVALPLATALFADALRAIPEAYTDLALSCGATSRQVRLSLLRQAAPALTSALGLVWLRLLGETGAAAIAGGNLAGSTRLLSTALAVEVQLGAFGRALGIGVLLLLVGALGSALLSGGRR